jgi:hypothetical protein
MCRTYNCYAVVVNVCLVVELLLNLGVLLLRPGKTDQYESTERQRADSLHTVRVEICLVYWLGNHCGGIQRRVRGRVEGTSRIKAGDT